jgi:hypothetical protein
MINLMVNKQLGDVRSTPHGVRGATELALDNLGNLEPSAGRLLALASEQAEDRRHRPCWSRPPCLLTPHSPSFPASSLSLKSYLQSHTHSACLAARSKHHACPGKKIAFLRPTGLVPLPNLRCGENRWLYIRPAHAGYLLESDNVSEIGCGFAYGRIL